MVEASGCAFARLLPFPPLAGQTMADTPARHPDPSGRFRCRWWDGTQGTSQVSTDGHHLIDTKLGPGDRAVPSPGGPSLLRLR